MREKYFNPLPRIIKIENYKSQSRRHKNKESACFAQDGFEPKIYFIAENSAQKEEIVTENKR